MNETKLKREIIRTLETQGFQILNGRIIPNNLDSKDAVRQLHSMAVSHKRMLAKKSLLRHEDRMLSYFCNGSALDLSMIEPHLVEVKPRSFEELLFRYTSLHWSIPVSSGYGRRLRFLVIDKGNDKLMGVIGLGDPVFNLGARDNWIGWSKNDRNSQLRNVMDAFCLGAVPPYSMLLGGKLVAALATSNQVRDRFRRKYGNAETIISNRRGDARLALLTTASALGRSSIYNRLKFNDQPLFLSVGYTRGAGDFHFSNGIYEHILEFANMHCTPSAKDKKWGDGFRNRREVIKKCLSKIGLSTEWLYHGIQREVFVIPFATNSREFLCRRAQRLKWIDRPSQQIWEHFRDRWMIPRSRRDIHFRSWTTEQWRIWPSSHTDEESFLHCLDAETASRYILSIVRKERENGAED